MIKSYQDLKVWQKSMELAEMSYRSSEKFPKFELFGLTSQLRRSAVSVCSNIAEGHSRQHTKQFLEYLSIAQGSLSELETQILIAGRLHYLRSVSLEEILTIANEIGRMISGLKKSLRMIHHLLLAPSL